MRTLQNLFAFIIILLVGTGIAAVCGQGTSAWFGLPKTVWAFGLCVSVNVVAFVPAYLMQSERFYDLVGALTTLLLLTCLIAKTSIGLGLALVSAVVSIWALRLGSFLARRVHREGKDGRFDDIKVDPARFLVAWSLQGLWVFMNTLAVTTAFAAQPSMPLGPLTLFGILLWFFGFTMEVVADRQKSRFRARTDRRGQFINEGLWARSQHPNYFGEMVLWTGVFLACAPAFTGTQWFSVVSPLFVFFLLTRISGIPMLRERAQKRWGSDPAYQEYVAQTPLLVPALRPPHGR